ncbi:MAG: response regulator transcription factor [Myxococcota bacterium]|nr:response regulator transcription factor [Myxococcota bacterium]
MAIRALLIDDDARLAELLEGYFSDHEIALEAAQSGAAGIDALGRGTFDVVLLDVMMPGMDGLEVLRRLRGKSAIPVIMLTARGDEADRVVGLELGADDYVPKPFSPRELLARIRAVLRRAQPEATSERIAISGVEVDVGARSVRLEGEDVELTGLELDILVALMRRAGRVVPRDALLSEAGRDDVVVGERTVDVHISHLRKKLGDDPRAPARIRTVRGVGYVFVRDA